MKIKNREHLAEIKGKLYGLTYCNTKAFADVLVDVIDEIGYILEDENKDKQDDKRRT
ncbi:MAG: hypothetical protein J6D20_07445 [Clostridia bacterium]|nr:hypothetical protein [Clostridia bacterium]